MATIRLKLLNTKRIVALNSNNLLITQGSSDNDEIVIAGESNVTKIILDYDESVYGTYAFYAELVNARGKGEKVDVGSDKTINISDNMTYAGYTKIFISARKDDQVVRWETFNLRVWSTSPNYDDSTDDEGGSGQPVDLSAINVTYNNSATDLQAKNVQSAIDEIYLKILDVSVEPISEEELNEILV